MACTVPVCLSRSTWVLYSQHWAHQYRKLNYLNFRILTRSKWAYPTREAEEVILKTPYHTFNTDLFFRQITVSKGKADLGTTRYIKAIKGDLRRVNYKELQRFAKLLADYTYYKDCLVFVDKSTGFTKPVGNLQCMRSHLWSCCPVRSSLPCHIFGPRHVTTRWTQARRKSLVLIWLEHQSMLAITHVRMARWLA